MKGAKALSGLIYFCLALWSSNSQAYLLNWQSAGLYDNGVTRSSTNVAFDNLFFDAFPSVSATTLNGSASASVSYAVGGNGLNLATNTQVDWSNRMRWSGIWANANANFSGQFTIESEHAATGTVAVDLMVSLFGDYETASLGLNGVDLGLDLTKTVNTISLLLTIGETYDLGAYLYSWVVGATPNGPQTGFASANGEMQIAFLMPSELRLPVPLPATCLLLGAGLLMSLVPLKVINAGRK